MKIYIGGDHAGFDLKEQLEASLLEAGHDVEDLGNTAFEQTDDYPDYAAAVAAAVQADPEARGILFCGNAEGVCIVANKFKGIRAAIGYSVDAATGSRNDDDVNVLCLPGRLMDLEDARLITDAFLETAFSEEDRHVRRLEKVAAIEAENFKH